jgi:hypothetical protein
MKVKIGLMSIMLLVLILAMAGTVSAATVNLVEKDTSTWIPVPDGKSGTLVYTMPTTTMTYTFTLNTALDANTEYCLVFYTRNNEGVSWLNSLNQVWGNQGSKVIQCATTGDTGYFAPMTGTFDFSLYGTGLDYINDGDDYDGSVLGAKVWLVPSSDLTGDTVTGWNPSNFLFEEDLITIAFGPGPGDNEAKFVLSESTSVVATLTCGNNAESTITFSLTRDGATISGPTTMTCTAGTSTYETIDTGSQTPNDIEKDWWLYDTAGNQLNYVHIEKNIGLPHWEVLTPTSEYEIPEFSTIAIPVASILGLLFFFNYRKRKREQ